VSDSPAIFQAKILGDFPPENAGDNAGARGRLGVSDICKGCGRLRSEAGVDRVAIGRRYTRRHGWHNATTLACKWCGTWIKWDRPIPNTVDEIIEYSNDTGHKFFCRENMRAFHSLVADGVTVYEGRAYFVTSEQDRYGYDDARAWGGRREYTVRALVPGGDVRTIGEFGEYATLRNARRAIVELARGGGE